MRFITKGSGSLRVLVFPSAVKAEDASELSVILKSMLNDGTKKILCDFACTTQIDTEAIAVFAAVYKLLHSVSGELAFLHMPPAVRILFEQAGIAHFFKFYDLEESIKIIVLNELVSCFTQYENVLDIRTVCSSEHNRIELYLEFDGEKTMREIQNLINVLRNNIGQRVSNSEILVIASAIAEEKELKTEEKQVIPAKFHYLMKFTRI